MFTFSKGYIDIGLLYTNLVNNSCRSFCFGTLEIHLAAISNAFYAHLINYLMVGGVWRGAKQGVGGGVGEIGVSRSMSLIGFILPGFTIHNSFFLHF